MDQLVTLRFTYATFNWFKNKSPMVIDADVILPLEPLQQNSLCLGLQQEIQNNEDIEPAMGLFFFQNINCTQTRQERSELCLHFLLGF